MYLILYRTYGHNSSSMCLPFFKALKLWIQYDVICCATTTSLHTWNSPYETVIFFFWIWKWAYSIHKTFLVHQMLPLGKWTSFINLKLSGYLYVFIIVRYLYNFICEFYYVYLFTDELFLPFTHLQWSVKLFSDKKNI